MPPDATTPSTPSPPLAPDTPPPSEMIHDAGRNTRESLGINYTPNIVPETTTEYGGTLPKCFSPVARSMMVVEAPR